MSGQSIPITASILYDLTQCPHRVTRNLFANPAERDPISPFVQLLWERGTLYEKEVIAGLKLPFVDLSGFAGEEKEKQTTEAIRRGETLIYNGRISHEDLLGEPDLLRREGDGYIAGDIKSGAGEEGGDDDPKPKKHYAVQLALYTEILERKRVSAGRRAFVWDIHGEEVPYDFSVSYGVRNPRTLWDDYLEVIAEARAIASKQLSTLPAYSSPCKQCWWYTSCIKQLEIDNDLTLIPEVGRSKRDVLAPTLPTIKAFAAANPAAYTDGKKTKFQGIGLDTLMKLHKRAQLLATKDPKPYLKAVLQLPPAKLELFFDIEVDPMRGLCYLHGFIERQNGDNSTERYRSFFIAQPNEEGEKRAFAEALSYLKGMQNAVVYYYSKYERTIYRKLQEKFPDVCSREEIDALFESPRSIDLYFDVVLKATEWPTRDFSLKTLAVYLGFNWRDTHPSGAASIEWFDRWAKTNDAGVKARILEYNEDDCRAARVLLDGVRCLS